MKITCLREELLSAFQTAALVAPTRSPKSILKNAKLVVDETGGTLMATDLEIGIHMNVPGLEILLPGKILAPISQLGSILRESSDEKLYLEGSPQGILIRGEHSEFHLPAQNPDEFPDVSGFETEAYSEVPARFFREMIHRTLFAADTESSRYALAGVLLEFDAERLTAVATDGRRLAKMEGTAQSVGPTGAREPTAILPARAMQLMERAIVDADGEVQIAPRANDLLVRSPRCLVYSRLVEGRFPKWRDVFPVRQNSARIDLAVGPLYSALRQAAIVTDEESRGIDFQFGEGSLVLSASSAQFGQSRVEFPVPYDGPPIRLVLDHRYVADFFRVLAPEQSVCIDILDGESAAVFSTDDGYGYVIMPMAREG